MSEPIPCPFDPSRITLGARRSHETFEFAYAGIPFSVGLGHFNDGRLAEVFLHTAMSGTQLDAMMRETAVLVSLLLQHGVASETIADALPQSESGVPVGPIGLLFETLELQAAGHRTGAFHAPSSPESDGAVHHAWALWASSEGIR